MTAPTLRNPPADDWSDLDDASLVPTGKTAQELTGAASSVAKIDVPARVSLGAGRSTEKTVNQVAQFKCDACNGTGRFVRGRLGYERDYGPCNKCKGQGKLKTDPETRAKRKRACVKAKQDATGVYIAAHIAEYTWATLNMAKFGFAAAMIEAIRLYGQWTDGQLAAIRKCIANEDARQKERTARPADAEVAGAGFARMLKAFNAATTSGLRNPKFRVGSHVFKPAKTGSTNAGCIYVTRDDIYLGRITSDGKLFTSRECTTEQRQRVQEICADPFAAAVLHGQQTGHCSCCGLELTNEESVRLGIGPICRGKWGL
jgi:hypothetical protein